jgi:hypothetical protein
MGQRVYSDTSGKLQRKMEVPRTDIEVFKASDDPSLKITQCASWI